MPDLLQKLESLHFTTTEAKVYLALLKKGELTGYQIGKDLGISRSSIYKALDSLYEKGAILLLLGNSKTYRAEDPQVLITRARKQFNQSADQLIHELEGYYQQPSQDDYQNIKGLESIQGKINTLIATAQKEIYFNTDMQPTWFIENLKAASKNGVRVLAFSFSALEFPGLPLEFYSYHIPPKQCGGNTRFMLVVDNEHAMIASQGVQDNWIGTYSQNPLLVSIVAEHIHHDIYLMKLKEQYGISLTDESLALHSLLEKEASDHGIKK